MSLIMRGKHSSSRIWSRAHPRSPPIVMGANSHRWHATTSSPSTKEPASIDDTLLLICSKDHENNSSHSSNLKVLAVHNDGCLRPDARETISLEDWEALVAAKRAYIRGLNRNQPPTANERMNFVAEAHEIDMIQAANSRRHRRYDKILFLVHHGEDESQVPRYPFDSDCRKESTDSLTRRGVGQALSLSRRAATFCTRQMDLQPDLFVVSPSRKVMQTTILSFPYDTPHHSIRATPWVCLSSLSSLLCSTSRMELAQEFAGVDFVSLASMSSTSCNSMGQAIELIDWLYRRCDDRVIVGKFFWCLLTF